MIMTGRRRRACRCRMPRVGDCYWLIHQVSSKHGEHFGMLPSGCVVVSVKATMRKRSAVKKRAELLENLTLLIKLNTCSIDIIKNVH